MPNFPRNASKPANFALAGVELCACQRNLTVIAAYYSIIVCNRLADCSYPATSSSYSGPQQWGKTLQTLLMSLEVKT